MIPPPGVCGLWVASRPRFDPAQGRLDALLSPAERHHVDRHHREADQRRLRLSRALLRLLLARYLELEPGRIPVDRRCPTCAQPHGKPRLRGRARLQFSVAHAGDLLVLAVQAQTPVGVDLEAVAGPDGTPPPELVELALTPAERWRRFVGCWTRKEAALKQLGTGRATPRRGRRPALGGRLRPGRHPRGRGRHHRPAPDPADRRAHPPGGSAARYRGIAGQGLRWRAVREETRVPEGEPCPYCAYLAPNPEELRAHLEHLHPEVEPDPDWWDPDAVPPPAF